MSTTIPSAFFTNNRQLLREAAADIPIVLTANGLLQRNADNNFPFSQDRNFWYLTGITLPDITLVLDDADEYLIILTRHASRDAFDGVIDSDELTRISGIKSIVSDSIGWARLQKRLRQTRRYATPIPEPAYLVRDSLYTNPAHEHLVSRIEASVPNVKAVDIRPLLAGQRVIKQPIELQALRSAIDITAASLGKITAAERFNTYRSEFQIEADLSWEYRSRGADGHAFPPIVAGGERACVLHHFTNSGILTANSLVVLDTGAEVNHYAADITRTVCYGKPSQRQQDVYAAVLDVQNYALGLLKPATERREYEQQVAQYMGTKLQQLGLIKTISYESVRKYFPHATSHYLGLDVHDVGDYNHPLEAGMVLTCEPGLYIPEEGIGVRIEDNVLITADGNTVLSAALPRRLML